MEPVDLLTDLGTVRVEQFRKIGISPTVDGHIVFQLYGEDELPTHSLILSKDGAQKFMARLNLALQNLP